MPELVEGSGISLVRDAITDKLKISTYTVSVKDYGAKGDGVTNDTAAIQSALDAVALSGAGLFCPAGVYRTTTPLSIPVGIGIRGERPRAKKIVSGVTSLHYGGSWFYFDHTGKGFNIASGGNYCTDFNFADFGTYRNQPAAAPGWTPNDHDFDFYCDAQNDITIENVMLLNATRGIALANAGGRLNVRRVRGQPFKVGIQIDGALDVVRIDNVHFWPFALDDTNVHAYTMANLDAIYSLRNDNPFLSNIFTIYARSGLRIGQSSLGGTSKLRLVNGDFDIGKDGVWVDSTVTTGTTGQFENITHQAKTSSLGGAAIRVDGANCNIDFGKLNTTASRGSAISVASGSNTLTVGRLIVNGYDLGGTNAPAVTVASGSAVYLHDEPLIAPDAGTGTGGRYGGAGVVSVNEWRSFTPVVTPSTGSLTSYTASGRYCRVGGTVDVQVSIAVTTNGTGGGGLNFALPIAPLGFDVGVGRNINSGAMLQALVATPNNCIVLTSANGHPAASGDTVVANLRYRVA
jgi:hypothetical protein